MTDEQKKAYVRAKAHAETLDQVTRSLYHAANALGSPPWIVRGQHLDTLLREIRELQSKSFGWYLAAQETINEAVDFSEDDQEHVAKMISDEQQEKDRLEEEAEGDGTSGL